MQQLNKGITRSIENTDVLRPIRLKQMCDTGDESTFTFGLTNEFWNESSQ